MVMVSALHPPPKFFDHKMVSQVRSGGKMTTISLPFGLRPGVMVKWSKIFDHDHGQNFKFSMVKWSKMAIFDRDMTNI